MLVIRRREFITVVCGAAAWSLVARAQKTKVPLVGVLGSVSGDASTYYAARLRALRQGLSETGFIEGRNVAFEYCWAEDDIERLPGLAADLVHRQVNVIVTLGGSPALLAAKSASTAIPIVFSFGGDPVKRGIVASLNRPGGNLTGITSLTDELGPKRLELLHEVVTTARVIGYLVNPANQNVEFSSREIESAARILGLQIHVVRATSERDLQPGFATLASVGAGGLVIGGDPLFNGRPEEIAALATRYAIPAIYQYRPFAAAGGLMSYGTDEAETARQVGIYAGRVLKGENPRDLPVQQATKTELFINLNTAKALGLTIPLALRGRADEIIE